METVVVLDLNELGSGVPALTDALGRVHAESAAVCLSDRGHKAQVRLLVKKIDDPVFMLDWPNVTEAMKRAYNDLQRTTELGACGIAILLVREVTGLTVIRASKKGTGFDYWLGRPSSKDTLPFQESARLEVSGILSGTESQFSSRVKKKRQQTETSDITRLPAYAVVVEFGQPQAEVSER